ncbi:MAG: ribosomal protein S18-alanine N-acetyltransferase [Candidatus Omnitrophica bacterium]|nr:ribosomal protein S18-alanine N-acetyltransferase [Candidatus Omnitrophota bacterium]
MEIEKASFPTPWTMGMFMEELSRKDFAFFIIARLKDGIAGYGGFWLVLDEAHLGNLAVTPRLRRRGIGERILKELIEMAKSKGVNLMTLEVRESNEKARALYEKIKFRLVAIRKGYYSDTKEDAYLYINDKL